MLSLLAAAATTLPPMPSQTFEYRQGGHVHDVTVIDTGNNNRAGATAEDGGRMRWLDGPAWKPATLPDDYRSILRGVFFLDAGNAWAVGDEGAVLYSSNGGQDWSLRNAASPVEHNIVSIPGPGELFQIHMLDSFVGFACGNDSAIAKTVNGGFTWTRWMEFLNPALLLGLDVSSRNPDDLYDFGYFPTDGSEAEVLIIVADMNYLWRVVDPRSSTPSVSLIQLTNPGQSSPNGSNDGLCIDDTPSGEGMELWAVDTDGDEAWVVGGRGTNTGACYYSDDRGVTWDQVDLAQPTAVYASETEVSESIPTAYGLTALGNGKAQFVTYADRVYRYEGGGVTGMAFDFCGCGSGSCSIVTDPTDPVMVQELPTVVQGLEPPLTAIHAINSAERWHCGRFGTLREWNGAGWTEIGSEFALRLTAGAFTSATVGCVVGQGFRILRTTDSGETWTTVYDPNPTLAGDNTLTDIAFVDAGLAGVAIGQLTTALKTADGGVTWSPITNLPGTPPDLTVVCAVPGTSTFYVSSSDGSYFVQSTDGGATWSTITVSYVGAQSQSWGGGSGGPVQALPVDVNAMAFVDAQTGTSSRTPTSCSRRSTAGPSGTRS